MHIHKNNNRGVFEPDAKPYCKTYAEWSAIWCKWLLSIPKESSPVIDNTGKNCSYRQRGPVWFLAGTLGGRADRKCSIPEGKGILFPIVVKECSYAEDIDIKAETELEFRVKEDMDNVRYMEASVDAVPLEGLERYRTHSELFNALFPSDNIYGVQAGITLAVCEGYWILLKPLPRGRHTIYFRASVEVPEGTALAESSKRYCNMNGTSFEIEVTYNVSIRPSAQRF